jgi:hypothetical protein
MPMEFNGLTTRHRSRQKTTTLYTGRLSAGNDLKHEALRSTAHSGPCVRRFIENAEKPLLRTPGAKRCATTRENDVSSSRQGVIARDPSPGCGGRFALTPFIQGRSRLREIRSYGSVRGVAGDRYPCRDCSKSRPPTADS